MGGPMFTRKRGRRASLYATSLVLGGLCVGWLLATGAHRGALDLRVEAGAGDPRMLARPARGHLGGTLFAQGLSHIAFHSELMKLHLAELVRAPGAQRSAVGVVGVEWGSEVAMFAEHGYTVYAFEPMPKFYKSMAAAVAVHSRPRRAGRRPWDVRLHQVAAGSQRNGTLRLHYGTEGTDLTETVRRGRLDDYVSEPLAVLSVDIQGNEYDVLRGATRLMSPAVGVRSLWVEVFPCNRRALKVMRMLDAQYMMFDFVPWGRPKRPDGTPTDRLTNLDKHSSFFDVDGAQRPSEFEPFFHWLCNRRDSRFSWMQTDILAIRRDLVTPQLMVRLNTLSHDLYETSVVLNRTRQQEFERRHRNRMRSKGRT